MRQKLLFILNARAGHGQVEGHLSSIIDEMVKADFEVRVHTTQGRGDATKIVFEEASNYDRIICSGGDGTLDEVVTGLTSLGKRIPIGYIPAGSTNDFGISLGLPKEDSLAAAKIAVRGKPFFCDLGSFNGNTFVYTAAFGLFTATSYSTPQNLKNAFGHFAYLIEGARELTDLKSYSVEVSHDGVKEKHRYLVGMVTNSSSIGGMQGILGDNIELNDGLFEVTLIRRPHNLIELNEILPALLDVGLLKNFESDMVERFKTKEVTFTTKSKLPWTLDGEFGGETTVATIQNLPKAMEIMVEE